MNIKAEYERYLRLKNRYEVEPRKSQKMFAEIVDLKASIASALKGESFELDENTILVAEYPDPIHFNLVEKRKA